LILQAKLIFYNEVNMIIVCGIYIAKLKLKVMLRQLRYCNARIESI
jgi:hypothetical protein